MELPFRPLRPWLIERFGGPMHRVALDAGSSCPNRDGTRGRGGCVYCDVEGSGTGALKSGLDLAEQLRRGMARVARRDPGTGVIAYLQSYSNTYVEEARLDEVLAALEPHLAPAGPVRCVAAATRPDTLPPWALERLAQLARRVEVWVELGLEAASDAVLTDINRLHTVAEFEDAAARARGAGLLVVGHAILGLPGDEREGARRTAELLARTGVEGVKVHNILVLKRTQLAHRFAQGDFEPLDAETYVQWLADFVERLAPEQVLHRLTADSPLENRLAPFWGVHKNEIRARLAAELERRGTRQGSLSPAGRGSARSSGT
ncbi:MAG: TIGR01212 family radical SAM protein [Planctomycetota bacterium]